MNPPGTTAATHVFSANGVYDPNITGTGHQPMGFDDWIAKYNHYVVLGSKLNARFTVLQGATTDDVLVGIQLKASPSVDTSNIETLIEQNCMRYKYVTNANATRNTASLTRKFSPKRFFGYDTRGSQYRGDNLTNPNEQAYYHLVAASPAAQDPSLLTVIVTIDYLVLFSERQPLSGS